MNTPTTAWKNHIFTDMSSMLGKRVLVRVDWNLPMADGKIADTSRADVTFPFLKELSFAGAKIIIMSHFGEKGESISPIIPYIQEHLSFVIFTDSLDMGTLESSSRQLTNGDALVIENVRLFDGETSNDDTLAQSFASLGDVYINNAFSVSHRNHASVVGVATHMLSYLGPTCAREIEHLELALTPQKPAMLIVGGAKISTKMPLIEHYLDQGVSVFIGGAMAHSVWKARGYSIGKSFNDDSYAVPEKILHHPLLLTPIDVVLENKTTVPFSHIPEDGVVVDAGVDTVAMIAQQLETTKTVIINGPLGLYEQGWLTGTQMLLEKVTESKALSYIGGGDTVTVAHTLGLLQKFTFVSLGGGAMLDYLASGTLPGIDAVTK